MGAPPFVPRDYFLRVSGLVLENGREEETGSGVKLPSTSSEVILLYIWDRGEIVYFEIDFIQYGIITDFGDFPDSVFSYWFDLVLRTVHLKFYYTKWILFHNQINSWKYNSITSLQAVNRSNQKEIGDVTIGSIT